MRANAVLERDQHVETLWSWGKRPGSRHDNAGRIGARRESKRRYDVSEKCSTEGEKYLHGYDFLSEEGLEVREATHDGLIFDPSSIHGGNEEQNHRVYESIAGLLPLRPQGLYPEVIGDAVFSDAIKMALTSTVESLGPFSPSSACHTALDTFSSSIKGNSIYIRRRFILPSF